jgi:hypothetical protein
MAVISAPSCFPRCRRTVNEIGYVFQQPLLKRQLDLTLRFYAQPTAMRDRLMLRPS